MRRVIKIVLVSFVGLATLSGITYAVLSQPANVQAPAADNRGWYVALGDSVAAGIGVGNYVDTSACDRSDAAYPVVLAKQRALRLTSLACSGATVPAGLVGRQVVNRLALTAQLTTLFAQPATPQLITITVGANDVNWTDILRTCYTTTCGSAADQQAIAADLHKMSTYVQTALQRIRTHYAQSPQPPAIVLAGYYQVFPMTPVKGCSDLTGIDANELAWGRQFQTDLNEAVNQAAEAVTDVSFTSADFTGHELCTADPWVQSLTDARPYHPTAAGQRAIATKIMQGEAR